MSEEYTHDGSKQMVGLRGRSGYGGWIYYMSEGYIHDGSKQMVGIMW